MGCAAGEVVEQSEMGMDGFVLDATVSSTGGQGGMAGMPVGGMPVGGGGGMPVGGMGGVGGMPPPVDMMPPDPPVGGQPDCMPGQRLGLCSVCGNDGSPRNPGFDPNCPVDCAGFAYEQVDQGDGTTICNLTERAAMNDMGPCQGLGSCEDDPAVLCGEPITQQIAQAGPCQAMEGCVGEEPAQVIQAPDGTPCGDGGMCVSGMCEVDDPCDISGFPAAAFAPDFCGAGQDGANAWCEWYVDGPGNNDYSCTQFCRDVGMNCLAGWNNIDGNRACGQARAWGCNEQADDQICRCTY
jgi:hypothetical protein